MEFRAPKPTCPSSVNLPILSQLAPTLTAQLPRQQSGQLIWPAQISCSIGARQEQLQAGPLEANQFKQGSDGQLTGPNSPGIRDYPFKNGLRTVRQSGEMQNIPVKEYRNQFRKMISCADVLPAKCSAKILSQNNFTQVGHISQQSENAKP